MAKQLLQPFLPRGALLVKEADYEGWKPRSKSFSKCGNAVKTRLFCPAAYRTGCTVQLRITESDKFFKFEIFGEHNADSHQSDQSKYLTIKQRAEVVGHVWILYCYFQCLDVAECVQGSQFRMASTNSG